MADEVPKAKKLPLVVVIGKLEAFLTDPTELSVVVTAQRAGNDADGALVDAMTEGDETGPKVSDETCDVAGCFPNKNPFCKILAEAPSGWLHAVAGAASDTDCNVIISEDL